jgi:Flp pilus assembly protein TadD
MRFLPLCLSLALICCAAAPAPGQEFRLPLPQKSDYTPVQQLNRDGVKALQKHNINKAKQLFYKAYLIDPNDPFTLNNLGYLSELEGNLDRAQRYYDQAAANTSEAIIDRSTEVKVEGKAVAKIAGRSAQGQMRVNQLNSQAVRLLQDDRAPEADVILQQALKIDPKNPFTLNNLGFAKEKEGELEEAIKNYTRAALTHSQEPIVVASNQDWRGKPISDVAARNADKTRDQLAKSSSIEDRVARLNVRGVSAMNRNERKSAREAFQQAYKLDPYNSFTINNMGYLAELDGDKETAESYYRQAQLARRAKEKVAVATRVEVEGRQVGKVAEDSSVMVDMSLQTLAEARRTTGAHPTLRTRDNKPVIEKPTTPGTIYTPPEYRQQPQSPNQKPLQPRQKRTNPPELKQRPPQSN